MTGAVIAASAVGEPSVTLPGSISVTGNRALGAGTAVAALTLQSDGDIEQTQNTTVTDIGDWLVPKINMSLYEARMVTVSGALSSGTADTWLPLSSTTSWARNRTTGDGIGSSVFQGTLEIRRGSIVLNSSSVTLTATQS